MRKSVKIRFVRDVRVPAPRINLRESNQPTFAFSVGFGDLRCFKNRAVEIESVLICFVRDIRVPLFELRIGTNEGNTEMRE